MLVEVTAIPVPTFTWAKVPVPFSVTTSGETIPLNVPLIVAALVLSYTLLAAVAPVTVKGIAVSANATSFDTLVVENADELVYVGELNVVAFCVVLPVPSLLNITVLPVGVSPPLFNPTV